MYCERLIYNLVSNYTCNKLPAVVSNHWTGLLDWNTGLNISIL